VRSLRPAGLINTSGRGPGGAEMTDWDATNLLLGAICSDQAKDAAIAVRRYRAMRYSAKPMLAPEVREQIPDKPGWAPVKARESLCPEPLRWVSESVQHLDLGGLLDGLIGMARTGDLQALFHELAIERLPDGVPAQDAAIDKAIDLGVVYLKLDFQRPRPSGRIVLGMKGHHQGHFLEVEFGNLSTWESNEDLDSLQTGYLVDTATIPHQVIFALGEALRH
jgi:hypothetical protein